MYLIIVDKIYKFVNQMTIKRKKQLTVSAILLI